MARCLTCCQPPAPGPMSEPCPHHTTVVKTENGESFHGVRGCRVLAHPVRHSSLFPGYYPREPTPVLPVLDSRPITFSRNVPPGGTVLPHYHLLQSGSCTSCSQGQSPSGEGWSHEPGLYESLCFLSFMALKRVKE